MDLDGRDYALLRTNDVPERYINQNILNEPRKLIQIPPSGLS